jgi:acetyl esterase
LAAPGPAVTGVRDLTISATAGPIAARLYPAAAPNPTGTVVYLHGGGWVTGDLEYSDAFCRHLAVDGGCTVLSVDYRLAPEYPFPAPLEDAYAALEWAAAELAGPGSLAVAGDSAGGALAAACTLRARDEDGPQLVGQLLVYPVVDADFTRPSYASNGTGLVLGPAEMAWFWSHYLPDENGRLNPLAAPLRAADLSHLPPAVIVVADLDPLRDEGLAYAARLAEAEVPVRLRHVPGLVHGFLRFTARVNAAAILASELAADLRTVLVAEKGGCGDLERKVAGGVATSLE